MTGVGDEQSGDKSTTALGVDGPLAQLRNENAALRARLAALESTALDNQSLRAKLDDAVRQNEERRQTGRALDREIVQLRAMLAEAERQMANIRQTFIYRIGEAIVSARTWKGLRQLPGRLIALRRAYLEKRGLLGAAGAPGKGLSERLRYVDESLKLLSSDGLDAALAHVRAAPPRDGEDKARALLELAHAIYLEDAARAASLAVEAGVIKSLEPRLRSLVLGLFDHGEINAPALILATLGEVLSGTPADRVRREAILAQERQLAAPLRFPPRSPPSATARRLAVIASRSLPHQIDAHSFRAQSVYDAARDTGLEPILITEPGYQYPRPGDGNPALRLVGGRRFARLPDAAVAEAVYDRFVVEVGGLLATHFAQLGISHVHSLAPPPLSAAALWAARETGASFTLDVGELPVFGSHVDADWEGRERFRSGLSLFAETANSADQVIVRSSAVAAAFAERGLLANARVVPDAISPTMVRGSDTQIADLRHALGVTGHKIIGVFERIDGDEGLFDLIRALPLIIGAEPEVMVLFVGSGPGVEAVRQRAVASGVGGQIRMASDFPGFQIQDYLGGCRLGDIPQTSALRRGNSRRPSNFRRPWRSERRWWPQRHPGRANGWKPARTGYWWRPVTSIPWLGRRSACSAIRLLVRVWPKRDATSFVSGPAPRRSIR